ncbi:MAG: hypothetical protein U0350_36245 [Caldilineaceae bacterium]
MKGCLYLIAIVVGIFVVGAIISSLTGSPQTTNQTKTINDYKTVYLSCPDCDDVGMPIYLYRNADLKSLACSVAKNDEHMALLLDTRNGVMHVQSFACRGWLAASLVKYSR